jgi:hypothetical protein
VARDLRCAAYGIRTLLVILALLLDCRILFAVSI